MWLVICILHQLLSRSSSSCLTCIVSLSTREEVCTYLLFVIHLILGVYALGLYLVMCSFAQHHDILHPMCIPYVYHLSCIHRCTQGRDGLGIRAARAGGTTRGATSRSWGGGSARVNWPPSLYLHWRQAPEHYKPPTIFVIMFSYHLTMVMYCCIKC